MADENAGIDTDSIKALDAVKKGKPHRFVMLCKGVKIQKLVVFRKGQPATIAQKAKKDGFSGTAFIGVVNGQGQDIVFELAESDGYDAPPGKELILKDFLKSAADFRCQPQYKIVKELTPVSEDDTPRVVQTAPPTASAPPPAPPPPAGNESARLATRLKALMPAIKAAGDGPGGERIKQLAGEVGTLGRQQEFARANALLDQVESLLKQSGVGRAPAPEFSKLWEQAKAAWQSALDTVNGQLEKLRVALLKEEDSELKQIAEFGLNAITADHKVPLQAAIVDLDRVAAAAKEQAVAQTKELVSEFRDHIDTDERVEACDDNPFDVKVAIRATLDPALAQMEQALERAFAA